MSDTKNMVRHSINLLEYPFWFQDERLAESTKEGTIWKDAAGYTYRCGYKAPVKTDVIFLLYLLLQSQKNNYAQKLQLSRYQIIQNCGLQRNSKWYARLEDSLERWKMVGIKFSGAFYDGNNYQTINFGIIDSWSIHEETKELTVIFSLSFIEMMLGKGFFKYINFSEFKQLRSPLATRLYEILCKSFHDRDTWEISAIKMAEKIPMKERYSAHIVPKIKAAVNRINKCSDTKFLLETRKIDRGQTVLCFRKTVAAKALLPFHQPENESFKISDKPEITVLINLLPELRRSQKTILEPVIAFYEMRGADYVARNIRYTNKNAKSNYRPYLLKALQNDYGLAMQEDEEAARQVVAQEALKAREIAHSEAAEQKRQQQQEENKKRAQAYIESLSEESRSDLQVEAMANMSDNIKEIVLKKGLGSKIMLNMAMENLALQKLGTSAEKQPVQQTLELAA